MGRVVDATGKPLDGKGDINAETTYPAQAPAPDALSRRDIDRRITTGVRSIDSMLTVGAGQRLGIFAGSGVGKSTLMSMIARNTDADINVIALVGERGREAPDFIKRDLGEAGLKRSVVVLATSDMPSICRLRAAYVATAIAEYFRDQGKNVMLMFDSITRFAQAQREIGLAAGEPPAREGFPPSVFDMIPKLLERAGANDKGIDHRLLHGIGGRRRHERPDRRHRARRFGRPHYFGQKIGASLPLSGRGRFGQHQPP